MADAFKTYGVAHKSKWAKTNRPGTTGEVPEVNLLLMAGLRGARTRWFGRILMGWAGGSGPSESLSWLGSMMALRMSGVQELFRSAGYIVTETVIETGEMDAVMMTARGVPAAPERTENGVTIPAVAEVAPDAMQAMVDLQALVRAKHQALVPLIQGAPVGVTVPSVEGLMDLHVAMAFWGMIKGVTKDNLPGFTVNRPKGILRFMNWAEDLAALVGPVAGNIGRMRAMNSLANLAPAAKRAVLSEAIRWTVAERPTPSQAVCASIMLMAKEQGMASYYMVRRLVAAYPPITSEPNLVAQIVTWEHSAKALEGRLPPLLRPYYKVLDGFQAELFARKEFPVLFEVALRWNQRVGGNKGQLDLNEDLNDVVNPILAKVFGVTVEIEEGHGGEDSYKTLWGVARERIDEARGRASRSATPSPER